MALQKHPLCMSWFVASICICVNVCVQVETRASKHSLFTHSCVEQQLKGVYACVCINECVSESFLPEPRGQTVAAENKKLCQCVSRQTSLTHMSAIDETLRCISSTDRFSNRLNGCLQLYKRFSSKTLEFRDWSIWLSGKVFTLDPQAEYAMGKNVWNLLSFHIVIGKGFSRHFLSYM